MGEPPAPTSGVAAEAEDRARFDGFLVELLGCFLGLSADQFDGEVERWQERICELFDLDRCGLWQYSEWEPGTLRLTHLHQRSGGLQIIRDAGPDRLADSSWISGSDEAPAVPLRADGRGYFPWVSRRLKQGETIIVARVEDLPAEAAHDKTVFAAYATKSAVILPLVAGEAVLGGLSFVMTREWRDWPPQLVQRFRLIAHVFSVALSRQRSSDALDGSEARLRLAANSAQIGMWMLDLGSERFWVSDTTRELLEYPQDAEFTLAGLLESVHPDDREPIRAAIRRAVETGEEGEVEFRVPLRDGSVRWVRSGGRVWSGTPGAPPRLLGASMDITKRKRWQETQAEQLRFEALLSELSAQFVNVPADQVDAAIEDAQRQVCECLGLDLSALWQWSSENPGSQALTHIYRRLPGPPVPPLMDAREHFPWCLEQLTAGRPVDLASVEDAPPEATRDLEVWRHYGVRSVLTLPLSAGGGRAIGSLGFNTLESERPWPEELVKRIRLVAEVFANAMERKHSEERLRASLAEVNQLRAQLELENRYLTTEYRLLQGHGRIVGESPAIMKVLSLVEQVAPSRSTVLVEGETGTGKELVAQRIHELSPRHGRPMVKVNCAALPSNLVESELFGREKGAFTGAVSREPGRFEVANGSTIFLDEVAELPVELQAKLLRVLEEGQFERVGSSRTLTTDVRVIAATNRDLQAEVAAGRFRRDLFYRLAIFPIRVPPLRDRREDIPLLVWSAVEEFSAAMHKSIEGIPRKDMERLRGYDWPGNVRELRNAVERAMILSSEPMLRIDLPPAATARGDVVDGSDGADMSLDEAQRQQIVKALEASSGRISGPGGAAERLGLKPTTLRSKMKRLRLEPRRSR